MGLLSIFKRQAGSPSRAGPSGEPADAVQQARVRARQRLIGSAVLVVIGIVGFPLVFETQPRPIPVDIPIELPRKDDVPPLVMPPARAPAVVPAASTASSDRPPSAAASAPRDVITESRDDAGRELAGSGAAAVASAAGPVASEAAPKPAASVVSEPTSKSRIEPLPAGTDVARARALLEGKPVALAEEGRFVVQVGAFADAAAARETRAKVEKLGLKTYTQLAATTAGKRIRVRVGPFRTRDEADKAMAKARGAGLGAVVLTL